MSTALRLVEARVASEKEPDIDFEELKQLANQGKAVELKLGSMTLDLVSIEDATSNELTLVLKGLNKGVIWFVDVEYAGRSLKLYSVKCRVHAAGSREPAKFVKLSAKQATRHSIITAFIELERETRRAIVESRVAGESSQIDLDAAWDALHDDATPSTIQIGKLKLKHADYDVDGDTHGSILFSADSGMINYSLRVYYKNSHAHSAVFYVFIEGDNLRDEDEMSYTLAVKSTLDARAASSIFNDLRKQLADHFAQHDVFTLSRQFKLGKFTMYSRHHGKYLSLESDKVSGDPLIYVNFDRNGTVRDFELDGVSQDELGNEAVSYDCVKQHREFFSQSFKSPADFVNKLKPTKIWARLATLGSFRYWPGRALMLDSGFNSSAKEPRTINDLDRLRKDAENRSGYLVFPSQEAYQTAIDALIEAVKQSGGKVLLTNKGALK